MEQDNLKTENTKLAIAFRDKSRKHQQTQELYDRLKRKEMTATTQSAAFDSVDEALQSVSNRQGPEGLVNQFHAGISPLRQRHDGYNSGGGFRASHRNDHENAAAGRMMPPPQQQSRPPFENEPFRQRKYSSQTGISLPTLLCAENDESNTPFGHRTRLGSMFLPSRQQVPGSSRATTTNAPATSHTQTPSQRHPMFNMNSTTINRPSVSGYGMSAGLKIGRQQGTQTSFETMMAVRFNADLLLKALD